MDKTVQHTKTLTSASVGWGSLGAMVKTCRVNLQLCAGLLVPGGSAQHICTHACQRCWQTSGGEAMNLQLCAGRLVPAAPAQHMLLLLVDFGEARQAV